MVAKTSSIELFMGAPVEHASERAALEKAYALVSAAGCEAVLFANFTVGGRQIDVLVATDDGALMIEAKGLAQPIDGGVNGPWHMHSAAGPMVLRNGYVQAVGAKHALRDAMAAMASPAPYPDAAVVLSPCVPAGSNLTRGDYKARVIDLDELVLPRASRAAAWPLDHWRAFARRHGLQPVPRLASLFDHRLLVAETALDGYGRAFLDTYGLRARRLLAFPCSGPGGEDISSDDLGARLAGGTGLVLLGPSGCGKSIAAFSLALERFAAGDVPLVVEAKLFDGRLKALLDTEAALLGLESFQGLSAACRQGGRRLLLVVDGYNECPDDQRFQLTRGLAALVRRTGAKLLVSSQVPLEGELLAPPIVQVPRPPLALKAAIARAAARAQLPAETESLLDAVGSGLEARMLGEVGGDLPRGASRFGFFDLYVRRLLGKLGPAGIATLSRAAAQLAERLTFSLSIRDFDRAQAEAGAVPEVLDALLETGLLARRGDRLSFGHELYLQAFQAEAVVRGANGDAAVIAASVHNPLLAPAAVLVLGAIDDSALLIAVLETVTDSQVIARCLGGEVGEAARLWAERRCAEVFTAGIVEIEHASFQLDTAALLSVRPDPATLRPWSASERAILRTLPAWLNCPAGLPDLLAAARRADARLAEEHRRLVPEARERKIPLRSGLFGQTYVFEGFGLAPSIGVNAGLRRWRGSAEDLAGVMAARARDLSTGEAYILLELSRRTSGISVLVAPLLPGLFDRMWRGAPYHLKLELLEAAGFCWQAEAADRQAVIKTLEALGPIDNIMLSTQWIEAMEQLGALDEDAERELATLREQMPELLACPSDPDQQHAACSLYYRRFDHPLSSAYCTAFDELAPDMQLQVLSMAAQVSEIDTFFAGPLIADLTAAGNAATVTPVARWAVLPSPDAMMPHEALANYLLANMALARHGLDSPPQPSPRTAAGRALVACARALHVANRMDLPVSEREVRLSAAWAELAEDPAAALVALGECCALRTQATEKLHGDGPRPWQILDGWENMALRFAREALADPSKLTGWFRPQFFTPEASLRFALAVLGRSGDPSDLDRLRAATAVAALADTALEQIRRLEERLFIPAAAVT